MCLAIAVCAIASSIRLNPFDVRLHRWEITLAVALAGVCLLASALLGVRARSRDEAFASVGSFGAGVIAVAVVVAELLAGPPQRVQAAPSQTYRPAHAAGLAIVFPAVTAAAIGDANSTSAVAVAYGARSWNLHDDGELRVGSYVLRAQRWPAAHVSAWSSGHVAETVTQPNGSAFVSPVLQFPELDRDGLPVDSFAVPALHREVRVKYYPGLPARGIDVAFLQLEIDEENGGSLYSGVTVSARPVRAAGMLLLFRIGSYPTVWLAGEPDMLPYVVGTCMLAVGLIGFVTAAVTRRHQS